MSDKQIKSLVGTPPMPEYVLCEGSGEIGHLSPHDGASLCARCGVRFYGLDNTAMPDHERIASHDKW